MNVGASVDLSFDALVNDSGTYKNVAQITSSDQNDKDSTPDNDDGDQSEDDEDSATASPNATGADLRLSKVVSDASPEVNDTITFTITVTNDGPDTATNVTVTDVVPDGFTYDPGSITGGDSNDDANPDTSGLTWTINSLAKDASVDLTFDVVVNASGDYKNVAQVTASDQEDPDSTPDNDDGDQSEDDEDSATADPNVDAADLSLVKAVDNTEPNVDDTVTFTITVTNSGPDTASNVKVTDVVPDGFSYVDGSMDGGNDRDDADPTGAGLEWTILVLDPNDSVDLSFRATVNPSGTYTNVAQISASDQNDPDSTPDNDDGDQSEDDEDSAAASPPADLFLSKTVAELGAQPGDTVVFTVTVRNDGPNDATGIEVGDQFPDGYTFVSATTSQGSYDDATGIWDVGDIAAYDLATLEITATVNASGNFVNIAQVTAADQADPDSTPNNDDGDQSEDDEASATIENTRVFDPPSGWKTVTPEGWPLLVWRMVWINNGNTTAFPVQVVDPIPNGTTYVAGSLTCEVLGASSTTRCEYDPVNDEIIWEGSIAPDFGAQNEDEADNEVIITFNTSVTSDQDSVQNQGLAYWDEDGDGDIDNDDANVANNNPVRTDDPATNPSGDPTVARRPGSGGGGDEDGEGGGGGAASLLDQEEALPGTGFAPGRVTILSDPANELKYHQFEQDSLRLTIPSLELDAPIVGVSLQDGNWNTDWLWNEIGYLEGTAFPTWEGNTVLTAHNYLPSGEPGPFVNLGQLQWGDQIVLYANGDEYTYEVRVSRFISPHDHSILAAKDRDWLTLFTCYQYDEASDQYLWRHVVQAVLIDVESLE